MALEKTSYVPIITFFLLVTTVAITFCMSWFSQHVTYLLPFISDTGTYPPESCVFGQMLNIISLLMVFVIYVRYRQLREILLRHNFGDNLQTLNRASAGIGYCASFGVSLVANFQETNSPALHWTGAIFAFFVGAIYQCTQSILSRQICRITGEHFVVKFALAALSLISSLIFSVGGVTSLLNFQGEDVTKWDVEDVFFGLHVASAIAEWISALSTAFFILLYWRDFGTVVISEPIVLLRGDFPKHATKSSSEL